jgi:hypothetical protein
MTANTTNVRRVKTLAPDDDDDKTAAAAAGGVQV